jgi:TolB-like protein
MVLTLYFNLWYPHTTGGTMKTKTKLLTVLAIFLTLITGGCGSTSFSSAPAINIDGVDELDIAIRDASDYLNDNIPRGSKIVILNIESNSSDLSDYIIDELIANAVNDRVFTVVDRQQLDAIRSEQNFQLSGEVADNEALAIGRFFGAQTIVSGAVNRLGAGYRIRIRALEVQTAQVQGQYNRNIASSPMITALIANGSSSTGTARASSNSNASGGTTSTATATPSAQATPAEPPITGNAINVTSVSNWNTAINTIRNGGNNQTYVINVTGNVTVPVINENLFGSVTGLTVTIQGNGTLSMSNTNGTLLRIGAKQIVIIRNVTLRGRSNNNASVVYIGNEGILRMEGGATITGNNVGNGNGGGVTVNEGGTFIMQGGTISGNTSSNFGGGVLVSYRGTFTMEDGAINGNTAQEGGGVFLGGTFTMQGGTISGNTATRSGGGVYFSGETFTMQGGAISGNTASGRYISGDGSHLYGGGGVYLLGGGMTFTKTGGTISGSDATLGERNTSSGQGHAIYWASRWRNATAGPNDNTAGYGFWLND